MNELFEHAGTAISQSEVTTFNFGNLPMRTQTINNQPYFCLSDVCRVLDIVNVGNCKARLREDGIRTADVIDSIGRRQQAIFINEPNLYKVIFQSRKPEAEKFTDWVTSEVLPSIRKHGGYIHANADMSDDEIMARALEVAHRTIERKDAQIKEQEEQLKLQAPDVQYCNDVLAAKNLHTVNSIAVHLGISPIRLNRFLVDSGYIYKQGGIYYPSCKIRDKGYCDFQHVPYINSNGDKMTREHLKWTETGRRFVIEAYKNKKSER